MSPFIKYSLKVITLSICSLIASISVAQRVEIEVNSHPEAYQVVSLEKEGVIVFADQTNKLFGSNSKWSFTHYNNELEEVWNKEVPAPRGNYVFQDYDTQEGSLFILFTKFSGDYLVMEVNTKKQEIINHTISALKNMSFEDFVVLNRYVFISGISRNSPVIIHHQLGASTPPQILKNNYGKRSELEKLDKDTLNDIIKVTAIDWKGGRSNMRVQSFLDNGEQVYDLPIIPTEEKNLLAGKLSVNKEGKLLIMGTYANRNSRYSDGIYIAEHDGEGVSFMKFYNFTALQNYFDYLPKERREALKKRTERKEEKGKDLNLQQRLLVHDVLEKENQYIMVAESYYPVYRYERRRDWATGGRMIRTVRIFDGYRYTHAVSVGFDEQGNLTWDGSFAIDPRKTMQLREFIRVGYHEGLARILFSNDGKIFSKTIENNKIVEGKSVDAIPTEYENDEIRKSNVNYLEYWYDDFYLAWGFQRIKNGENTEVKLKRNVLYFNKVKY